MAKITRTPTPFKRILAALKDGLALYASSFGTAQPSYTGRTCGRCDKHYAEIPADAKEIKSGVLAGFHFHCECRSGIFVPYADLKESRAA